MTENYVGGVHRGSDDALSRDEVANLIDEALARQAEQHKGEIESLRSQVGGNVTPTRLTTNSAGIDVETNETWSLFDQELAQAGKHPLQK